MDFSASFATFSLFITAYTVCFGVAFNQSWLDVPNETAILHQNIVLCVIYNHMKGLKAFISRLEMFLEVKNRVLEKVRFWSLKIH